MANLVVVAHPDDEVIGAGIWMHRHAVEQNYILHITDGSPPDMQDARRLGFETREAYSQARRKELACAVRLIPVPDRNCLEFGFPDKESYLHLPEIVERLRALIAKLEPAVVITHAYEGGHPDHDSAAFAVTAVRGHNAPFRHLEFPLYRAGANGKTTTTSFRGSSAGEEIILLSHAEQALKKKMLACFATQGDMLKIFGVETERFREAPNYDFTKAPHSDPLWYERLGWGVTGEDWREQARKFSPASARTPRTGVPGQGL